MHVALIHHGDNTRLPAARTTVRVVTAALQEFGTVRTSDVWRQPDRLPIDTSELIARRFRQWQLERRWARHTGVSRRWVLSTGLLLLRLAQLSGASRRESASRQAFIEHVLTSKHVQAWQAAFSDDVDALVVLEDDARTDDGSPGRLRDLVQAAGRLGEVEHAYLDLAGGLELRQLRLDGLTESVGSGVLRLNPAATNTACGYLIGRHVIEALLQQVVSRPEGYRLPADWLLNASLMAAASGPTKVLCLHADPPPLTHGSLAGSVVSSVREVS